MTDTCGQWVAVADASLEPGQVVADDEHDVVVWRTADGQPCVMDSRCPHQWSHLAAEGVVDGDELVCAAHFWRFALDGSGSKLSMGGGRDEKSAVEVFPCREEGGRIVALVTRTAIGVLLALATILLPVLFLPAGPASAGEGFVPLQSGSEGIRSFDVEMEVQTDGSLLVNETIAYDFGFNSRHGIERYFPVRFPYDGDGAEEGVSYERITPIDNIQVSSATAPADVEESDENDNLLLRIGDPDRTISGQHTYEISYQIHGVFNSFEDHDELFYNVTGNGWNVPIDSVDARVTSPVAPTQTACYAGPAGSRLECTSHSVDGTVTTFTQTGLGPNEGLTIVEALPPGTVNADPILDEVWSPGRAFRANGTTVGGGMALLVLGGGLIGWMLWSHGRDRRFRGSAVDAAFADSGEEEKAPLLERPINPVEFVPPEGIRPGHMGTLYDEVANPLDVSAMIIDLAVRGYLRIEEVEAPSQGGAFGFGRTEGDYRFVKGKPVGDELLPSEQILLAALFRDNEAPVLSELRTKFAERLALVQGALYDDAVAAGWFPSRPDRVRAKWRAIGLLVLVLGIGIVVLTAWRTHYGLLVLPLPLLGLALVALADRFPRRTSKGTAMLGRIRGFKELFDVGEGDRQRFIESKQLFSQYLPYTIVFGMAEQWAQTFESLGLSPEDMGVGTWYVSPYGYHPLTFAYAMGSFSTVTTGSIAAAAPSSSAAGGSSGFSGGGFSGGGFGGGGGGSW